MDGFVSVLVVGSHPDITAFVVQGIRERGYAVTGVVGPEAGLVAIDREEVDAMIVGGPEALSRLEDLIERLRAKNPHARVIVPRSPEGAVASVDALFGDDLQ